jgi:hypothetical protein
MPGGNKSENEIEEVKRKRKEADVETIGRLAEKEAARHRKKDQESCFRSGCLC